jgi:hypothetical protein
MGEGRYYRIAAYGENAARFKRLLAVSAPSAGGGYLSEKFEEFVEAARLDVRLGDVRLTKSGVATNLTISEAGIAVKYNVYLHDKAIELEFHSTDRGRVELAARLLRHAGVVAEVRKESGRDAWRVDVTTNKLAAGCKELRNALAEFVKKAVENGRMEAGKAEGWLKGLERGLTLKEGWPRYYVGLDKSALVVKFGSPRSVSIQREAQRLREMGLEERRHFTVKMPESGNKGYVRILREGLAYAAWLSVYGKGKQQKLAADFVEYILQRAKEAGEDVRKKAEEIVKEGKARDI